MRLRFRFSLRTLLLLTLLVASLAALRHHWEPWVSVYEIPHAAGSVFDAQFSPDEHRFVTAGNGAVARVFDTQTGALLLECGQLPEDGGARVSLNSAKFSSDGSKILVADDADISKPDSAEIRIYDSSSAKLQSVLETKSSRITTAVFLPDGKHVASLDDRQNGKLVVWEIATQTAKSYDSPGHNIHGSAISADGRRGLVYLRGNSDPNTVTIWNLEKSTRQSDLPEHRFPRAAPTFSPDGTCVALFSDDPAPAAEVFNADTGKLLHSFSGYKPEWGNRYFVFSGDNKFLAVGDNDGKVRVFNLPENREVAQLGPFKLQHWVLFSKDSTRLLTPDYEFAYLWDMRTGQKLAEFNKNFNSAVFSRSGDLMLTADAYCTATLWQRRRPEQWWGIGYLPEFWLTLILATAFICSGVKDIRTLSTKG
jgi:WD40 repeat protein